MKKCFMKKLLSSFLALTMVVTTVPANVVSATTEKQLTQEAKKQNKQKVGNLFSKAKKIAATVAENSSTVLNGAAAGASAVLAGATYLNVSKQIKELKKTVDNKEEFQNEEQFSEKITNMLDTFKNSILSSLNQNNEKINKRINEIDINKTEKDLNEYVKKSIASIVYEKLKNNEGNSSTTDENAIKEWQRNWQTNETLTNVAEVISTLSDKDWENINSAKNEEKLQEQLKKQEEKLQEQFSKKKKVETLAEFLGAVFGGSGFGSMVKELWRKSRRKVFGFKFALFTLMYFIIAAGSICSYIFSYSDCLEHCFKLVANWGMYSSTKTTNDSYSGENVSGFKKFLGRLLPPYGNKNSNSTTDSGSNSTPTLDPTFE